MFKVQRTSDDKRKSETLVYNTKNEADNTVRREFEWQRKAFQKRYGLAGCVITPDRFTVYYPNGKEFVEWKKLYN